MKKAKRGSTDGAIRRNGCHSPSSPLSDARRNLKSLRPTQGVAQGKYRNFIQDGIGIRSIWEKLEAQSLLGVEGFAEAANPRATDGTMIRIGDRLWKSYSHIEPLAKGCGIN
jgi:hypothetical protein